MSIFFANNFWCRSKFQKIFNIFKASITGGEARGNIGSGDEPIPPGIDLNSFHFEKELFLFKIELVPFIFYLFIVINK